MDATICDTCGDESNSAPGLKCGRMERHALSPCPGVYRINRREDVPPISTADASEAFSGSRS